jgi:hypothetical protein
MARSRRITLDHLGPEARRQAQASLIAQAGPEQPRQANKYHAVATLVDGLRFDSKVEAGRYGELCLLQRAGVIRNLTIHRRYPLEVNGVLAATYEADFVYERDEISVVEDVKSTPTRTREYRIKKKLMKAIHGLDIREVMT